MDSTVKSARRVTEILEYFSEHQGSASAHDVRTALGYPQSSTSALLYSLVALGYLTCDRFSRTFRPTIRVALLGSWMLDEHARASALLIMLEKLRKVTGDTVLLGAQNGTHLLYLQVLQAMSPLGFYMKPGSLRPLCLTAVGLALLSTRTEHEIITYVRRINLERNAHEESPLRATAVMEAIERGRRMGYFATWGAATNGAAAIAMPLPPIPDHPPLAVGIGGPIDRLKEMLDEYVARMRENVAQLAT
jgi:DNA-binding IclR family transcriptional regulator